MKARVSVRRTGGRRLHAVRCSAVQREEQVAEYLLDASDHRTEWVNKGRERGRDQDGLPGVLVSE